MITLVSEGDVEFSGASDIKLLLTWHSLWIEAHHLQIGDLAAMGFYTLFHIVAENGDLLAGIQSCNGSPEQQWEFEDGTLYNELMDQCLTDQPLCLVDYTLFNTDITASSK